MLSVIERVIILKTVDLFSEVPDYALVDLAPNIREIRKKADDPVISQGDPGTTLYIIVSGRVKVHIGEKILTELIARDFFGEMSALDSEVRSASVTALENTLLFSIDQESVYELIGDHTIVAREIIHILSERIRKIQKKGH